jgi:uncharacterized protein YndB with AHSA1/START domain
MREEEFPVSPEQLFRMLVSPSAIRRWWSAASAIVIPREGGVFAVTWGGDEDDPDYATAATIVEFDPPRRFVLKDYRAVFRLGGGPPVDADFVTEFAVRARAGGAVLRVTQDGFPVSPEGDAFRAACDEGWRNTFAGIRAALRA